MKPSKKEPIGVHYWEYLEAKRRLEELKKSGTWPQIQEAEDRVDAMERDLIPEKNMPGTVHYYTDCSSGYVGIVLNPRKVVFVQNGLFQSCDIFTKRKNGLWVKEGEKARGGLILTLGYKHDYRCEEI